MVITSHPKTSVLDSCGHYILKATLDLQRLEIEAKQKIESAKAEAEPPRLQKQEVSADLLKLR